MGCSASNRESVIYNATVFPIFIQIFKDRKIIQSFETEKEAHAELEGGIDMAKAKVGGSYKNKVGGYQQYADKDMQGFRQVQPKSYSKFETLNEIRYLTIKAKVSTDPENGLPIYYDLFLLSEIKGQFCLIAGISDEYESEGFDPDKHLRVEIGHESIPWRVADGSQNYFIFGATNKCNICKKRISCNPSCQQEIPGRLKGRFGDEIDIKMNEKFVINPNFKPRIIKKEEEKEKPKSPSPKKRNKKEESEDENEDEDDDEETKSPSKQKKCPNGHKLINEPYRGMSGALCNACMAPLLSFGKSCSICDFDLCKKHAK